MTDAPAPSTTPPRLPLLAGVAIVAAALAAIDVAVRLGVAHTGAAERVVDLHTPGVVDARMRRLAAHDGARVVLLGDSLVVGRAMSEHGDAAWREHELATILAARLAERSPALRARVENLGLDGAVPADLLALAERIVPAARPDLVVLDLSLRSFSRDFAAPAAEHTRAWLGPPGAAPAARVEAAVDAALSAPARRAWALYGDRDLLHAAALGSGPRRWLAGLHGPWAARRAPAPQDEMMLLMKARKRFETVDLRADNPQRRALERLLELLATSGTPAVIFYAREEPGRLEEIVERPRYEALRRELDELVRGRLGPAMEWVGAPAELPAERYLDQVHVDAAGYRLYLEHLWPAVARRLEARPPSSR